VKVTRFGRFTCEKGETEDLSDFWIDVVGFEFDNEDPSPLEKVQAVLDHIQGAISEALHSARRAGKAGT
jgi:hypothetical protein